jgi:hypothetical protein
MTVTGLLALVLLLQETPAEAFQKIESAIENARALKVEFTLDASAKEVVPGAGFLSIEEGGRAKSSAELKSKQKRTIVMSMDCDGKTIASSFGELKAEAAYDPKRSRSNFNMYLSRLGVFAGALFHHFFYMGAGRGGDKMSIDMKQLFQVENLKFGGDGKNGTKILSYDFKIAFEPKMIESARLWYDPKTYKLVRRECRMVNREEAESVYEEYTEVKLGDEPAAGGDAKSTPSAPPPIPDSELDTLFFKAKLQVAESHLKSGKKSQAAEVLEDVIKTYPKHSLIPEARRLLDEAKKK